jgi:cytochrome P450
MFETMDYELHRKRHIALNPFFSKRSAQAVEPVIQEKADELLARLRKALNTNQVVDLSTACAALAVDIVSEYAFGECTNSLQKDDWGIACLDLLHFGVQVHPPTWQFPWFFSTRAYPYLIARETHNLHLHSLLLPLLLPLPPLVPFHLPTHPRPQIRSNSR